MEGKTFPILDAVSFKNMNNFCFVLINYVNSINYPREPAKEREANQRPLCMLNDNHLMMIQVWWCTAGILHWGGGGSGPEV